jgi:hypothetical protein
MAETENKTPEGGPSRRLQAGYLALVVAAALAIGVLTIGLTRVSADTQDLAEDNAALADETHAALCAQRTYYGGQIARTEEYLETHPGPEPIPGISRSQLERSLEAYRDLKRSTDPLDCRGE